MGKRQNSFKYCEEISPIFENSLRYNVFKSNTRKAIQLWYISKP